MSIVWKWKCNNINMKKKNKIIIIVSISVAVLTLATLALTYAFLGANIGGVTTTSTKVVAKNTAGLTFETGDPITLSANQDNFASGKSSLTASTTAKAILTADNESTAVSETYNVYLYINKNDYIYTQDESTPELLLTVTDPTGAVMTSMLTQYTTNNMLGVSYKTDQTDVTGTKYSGYDVTNKTGIIHIKSGATISTKTSTEQTWKVSLTFLNLDADQGDNSGKTFEAVLIIQKDLLNINNMVKSKIITNYSTPSSGIYYHDSNLANGANDNSYRYYGKDPSNYVCFGYPESLKSMYEMMGSCPSQYLYRIIGVIDDKVKLIKYDYINDTDSGGTYKGSTSISTSTYSKYKGSLSSFSTYYYNLNNSKVYDFSTSELNSVNLNDKYLTSISNSGIDWSAYIADSSWPQQACNNPFKGITTLTPKETYDLELTDTYLYQPVCDPITAKIGLMYASDYAYSADSGIWAMAKLGNYSGPVSMSVWMFMGLDEWTMSAQTGSKAYYISNTGNVTASSISGSTITDKYYGIRPVFNLKPGVEISKGSGTKTVPYFLK